MKTLLQSSTGLPQRGKNPLLMLTILLEKLFYIYEKLKIDARTLEYLQVSQNERNLKCNHPNLKITSMQHVGGKTALPT